MPASLDALVPDFLPEKSFDTQIYRVNSDGTYLLYDLGDNLLDDGGQTEEWLDVRIERETE